jgi:hypothetical protein
VILFDHSGGLARRALLNNGGIAVPITVATIANRNAGAERSNANVDIIRQGGM